MFMGSCPFQHVVLKLLLLWVAFSLAENTTRINVKRTLTIKTHVFQRGTVRRKMALINNYKAGGRY